MKKIILPCIFLVISLAQASAQNKTFAIGTASPNANAALHVESPGGNQGFLMPRLTTAQRTAMVLAASDRGLSLYDITLKTVFVWDGTSWTTSSKAKFNILDPNSLDSALTAKTYSNKPHSFAVSGIHKGTGDAAGFFIIDNSASSAPGLFSSTNGSGSAFLSYNFGTGPAGSFVSNNPANSQSGIYAETVGAGAAAVFNAFGTGSGVVAFTQGPGSALQGNTDTGFSAIYGRKGGATNGHAGSFEIVDANNGGSALLGQTTGRGTAGEFIINNATSSAPALVAITNAAGDAAYFTHNGPGGNILTLAANGLNVARVDKTGKGYFNGGTQNNGADVAELFEVKGSKTEYEPGDVLVISESSDRTMERSSSPNSSKVAGVFATKPGVILTEKEIEETLDELVPLGVIGVIPTKVCLENGTIKRGDLLVTSSKPGHAMKAVSLKGDGIFPAGIIIGKALENFDGTGKELIKVLVNVK